MAEEIELTRSRIFAPAGTTASGVEAAGLQVRVDFEKNKLAKRHAAGKLSDKKYLGQLQDLAQQYRKGSGVRGTVRETILGAVGGPGGIVESYEAERKAELDRYQDNAQRDWNEALREYALGNITETELNQTKVYYDEAMTGRAKVPKPKKLTQLALSGKLFNQYKSGRMRKLAREKGIRGDIRDIYGDEFGRKEVRKRARKLAGTEGTRRAIRAQVQAEKGITRDLKAEQEALGRLVDKLGRLPTHEEIRQEAYG